MRATLCILSVAALGPFGCVESDDHASCTVDGVTHTHGSDFPSSDGCNTCHCTDGNAACTARACVTTCTYDGQTHPVGTSFPSTDGCNTCSCGADGTVACTTRACVTSCTYDGATHPIGDHFPAVDGCNTCTCTASGAVTCTQTPCLTTCRYDGAHYEVGDQFPAVDGCNTCTCMADGSVSCTEMACAQTCEEGGRTWQVGDTFDAADGCNTCTCLAGGVVACTEKACLCAPASEWWRHYESTDVAACNALFFTCPGTATHFENACGCGCAQSAECAKEIDCFDTSCDATAIHEACPYSQLDTTPDCSSEMPCKQFLCMSPGASWGCGRCEDPPPETVCENDTTCGAGAICEPLACACHAQKTCVAGCTSDGACGEGERCGTSGRCEPTICTVGIASTCPANFACDAGRCRRRSCTLSTACDEGGFCVNGSCYAETGNCFPPAP